LKPKPKNKHQKMFRKKRDKKDTRFECYLEKILFIEHKIVEIEYRQFKDAQSFEKPFLFDF